MFVLIEGPNTLTQVYTLNANESVAITYVDAREDCTYNYMVVPFGSEMVCARKDQIVKDCASLGCKKINCEDNACNISRQKLYCEVYDTVDENNHEMIDYTVITEHNISVYFPKLKVWITVLEPNAVNSWTRGKKITCLILVVLNWRLNFIKNTEHCMFKNKLLDLI